jgi:hypothetical protein
MMPLRNWLLTIVTSLDLRKILAALVYIALAIAIVLGFKNGWLDLRGHPIQHIRNLQAPVDERNRQIDELIQPLPKTTQE